MLIAFLRVTLPPRQFQEVTMVPLMSLWIPIVLSAVIVFVASSAIHMILTYHKGDFGQVPSEDGVREALRGAETGARPSRRCSTGWCTPS